MADDVAFLTSLAGDGTFVPVIDRTFSAENGAGAHAYLDTKRKPGSTLITFA